MTKWKQLTVLSGLCLCGFLGSSVPAGAQTTRVSVTSGGAQVNNRSLGAVVSADGRYVAFQSEASNLVPGDTNNVHDVFVHDRVTGMTTRVNVSSGGAQGTGDGEEPAISADGRFVAFSSASANLVAGDTNSSSDIFVHDRVGGTTTRVSVATAGGQGDFHSEQPALSADGRYVAFMSQSTNLVAGDTNNTRDVFVHDRATGITTRVSVATGGVQATGQSLQPALSADGRYVVFGSDASNLVVGDTNNVSDIFVHDRLTGTTRRVSVAQGGGQASLPSSRARMSADGKFVAFTSYAPNLVPNDTNAMEDVFVHELASGTISRVSVATGGTQATGATGAASLSADGRYIAFHSLATNLVPGDTNDVPDVFLHDRSTGTTRRVSVTSSGAQAIGGFDNNGNRRGSLAPSVSGDGRVVTFDSWSYNLVPGDTNGFGDIFVHDTRMYQRRRVSVTGTGAQAAGASAGPAVSADGRYVAFYSDAANLVAGDTNGVGDIFVQDRVTRATTRVNVATGGAQATGHFSDRAAISGDGRYVAFQTRAANLVPGDTNDAIDVFVHDRATGLTTRASVTSGGGQASSASDSPALSADGRYVAFLSDASNLVPGDTNGLSDVFVHDLATRTTTRVSVSTTAEQATGGRSFDPALSADGRYVAFASDATNLVVGDANGYTDIYLHDRSNGETTRVNVNASGSEAVGGNSYLPALSADGQRVVFTSLATNLAAVDTNLAADVFMRDRGARTTTRVSVSSDGVQADGYSFRAAMSRDGRYVAYQSNATNLVEGDNNSAGDIFVRDLEARQTVRASLGEGQAQGNSLSGQPALSADGRVLAYQSLASDLVSGDTNGMSDVFVRALTPVIHAVSPRSGPTTGGTTLRIEGAGFQPGTTVSLGALDAQNVDATDAHRILATTPRATAGMVDIAVTVPGYEPERALAAFTYMALSGSATADADGDGLPDAYEAQYSLDPLSPHDAAGDPDGDGVLTAAERAAGTHPNGRVRRYLAEGAASDFFRTDLALTNPGQSDATVLMRFLPSTGAPISHWLRVPAHSRANVAASDVPGLGASEFSTVLESDALVVLDRVMRWGGNGYGSHAETALPALSQTWYLAEGATHNGFDLFYLLQNPATTSTVVQVTFLRPAPLAPIVKDYTLAPQSRFNIWVDQVDPALANTDVSAQIVATRPIAVERAMYLTAGGRLFTAGHQSAAVTSPALSWFLAEGATGPYFDMFVLLANTNTTAAEARVTFLKPDGSTVVKTRTIPARSRVNIWVDHEDPALADTAVSTTVEVTNGVPIVVERSMWWPGTAATWQEAHNSPGATTTGTAWVVASGEDGGPSFAETYVLVANTGSFAATARVTVLLEDGKTEARHYTVPARSRMNVPVRSDFPAAAGRRFGVLVESVGVGTAPLVVESAVYSGAGGVWEAGANALATRLK